MKDEQLLNIERYISKAMSHEERALFEQELKSDPELHEAYELSLKINEHLLEDYSDIAIPDNEFTRDLRKELRSEESKKIKKTIASVGQEYANKATKPRRINYGWVAGIAAAFIIGIGLTFFTGNDTNNLYEDYY
ncbi:MAG: hypothetical protein K0U54_13380, partial [Bacteroidetes bacterium]|nr:hypothetical protein [Bacteroidota bacterium]